VGKPAGEIMLRRIVSGGQTGVDRAALDVALALGLPCGGWCPRGRRAEDGPISALYPLSETPVRDYPQRTEWNVRDADATLILTRGKPDRGTALTRRLARRQHKPVLVVDLQKPVFPEAIAAWLASHQVGVLNVAGPRESRQRGIYAEAAGFLYDLLASFSA
jgi:hypothetical protein